jgi:transposase
LATRRSELAKFQAKLSQGHWQRLADNPDVEVKLFHHRRVHYLLARSKPRRQKERAIRRRQRRGLAKALQRLQHRVAAGRLQNRDKILECVGRLKGRFPKACPFVTITVGQKKRGQVVWMWKVDKFKAALAADGAYLLRSNQAGWSAQEFWETYIQLTVVEKAFRVLKSELQLRPVWHQYSGRTQAHVLICVLAYALWKTLDHLAKQAGLHTLIHKQDPQDGKAGPQPRPMTPEVILRELSQIQIGDILLETTDGQQLALRRVARPNAEQKRILAALQLTLPERLSPDRLL